MIERLLLLTDEVDVIDLVEVLQSKINGFSIECVRTKSDFECAVSYGLKKARLLSFCSSVIVPATILEELDCEAYNIHPGSPQYPGSYPACWATYEGAQRFGATLHVMRPRVDEGEIIDTAWCEVNPEEDSSNLARRASAAALMLLMRWIPVIMSSEKPLTRSGEAWTGPKRRVDDLALLAPGRVSVDLTERRLRERAIAQALYGPAKLEKEIAGLGYFTGN